MINLRYKLRCRQCSYSDGNFHVFIFTHDEPSRLLGKSEYEVNILLENLDRLDSFCTFCNSKNIEIFDTEMNGSKFYNSIELERQGLNFSTLKLEKNGGSITIVAGGSRYTNSIFFDPCMQTSTDVVSSISEDAYTEHDLGDFFICVSGGYNQNDDYVARVERLYHSGISKDEVVHCMETVFDSEFFRKNKTYLDYRKSLNYMQ